MNHKSADRIAIVQAMKAGGYFDHIMQAGPELDRVKAYLRSFEAGSGGATAGPQAGPLQYPDYPLFPGLRNLPFRDVGDLPGPALLQQNFDVVHGEWTQVPEAQYLRYTPPSMHSLWQVHLLHYMGVDLQAIHNRFAGTHALLRGLPGICLDYPWGDALLSVHASDSHLAAHCSVDNLRVRCHLALQVPPGCSIRVGTETRTWEEGKALVFEDSFEHEVWNRGQARRAILIVDFWHPDLTAREIEALTAGFRKAEVRSLFMLRRLQAAHPVPDGMVRHLQEQVALQDEDESVKRYWPAPQNGGEAQANMQVNRDGGAFRHG